VGKIIGIDLGTTNSLVAIVESGIPLVLADGQGRRLTPSVVRVPASGEPVVGWEAKRGRAAHPETTVTSIKRFIGRRGDEVDSIADALTYPIHAEGSGPVAVPLHGRDWSPEELSAKILKALRTIAAEGMIDRPEAAVITVPAYFNDAQRNATRRAGELAGLRVERIINEPTAAALAYGLGSLKEKSKVAVYDLGGGTFDLSILELNEGVFQVLATCGNTRLGGDDIDRALIDHLAEQIGQAGGPSASSDPVLWARLAEAAEDLGDQARAMVWLVEEGEELHPILGIALGEADEVAVRFPVAEGSTVAGSTLKDLQLNIEPGFTVLAIRRDGGYVYRPRGAVRLVAGDEIIASGPEEGQALLAAMCGWELLEDEGGEDELVPVG